jgi:hypothetical protein
MTLIEIALIVVVAGMVLLFGGLHWVESRRSEIRRPADAAGPSDTAAGASDESPERQRCAD